MIIAVDYDGTLDINGTLNEQLIGFLKAKQAMGNTVILWTCRDGRSLQEAVTNLAKAGLRPNYVNANCPQAVKMLGHDSRKVYADIYIDDRGVK